MGCPGIQYYREKTQIIFFDLEFYVPKEDREGRMGLKANPYRTGHFLIGGTLHRYFPLVHKRNHDSIKEFWIWNYKNEAEMMKDIIAFIEESWSIIYKKDNQAELFYSGIGISRVDIQYLFAKAKLLGIKTEEELFNLFYKGRFLDFETIVIPYFKNKDNMMKTKTTKDILSKFKIERKRGPSISVWDQYDAGEYEKIRERNVNEVADLPVMYQAILTRIHSDSIVKKYSINGYTKRVENFNAMEKSLFDSFYDKDEEGCFVLKNDLTDENKETLYRLCNANRNLD